MDGMIPPIIRQVRAPEDVKLSQRHRMARNLQQKLLTIIKDHTMRSDAYLELHDFSRRDWPWWFIG